MKDGYRPIRLITSRGNVDCRYYQAADALKAVIWVVSGVGGDWDTPARGLYPYFCQILVKKGISALRVQYRYRTDLCESVLDVSQNIKFLEQQGIKSIGLVGHSFGGAVVVQAATASDAVSTIVTLSTQSYGTEDVSRLKQYCSILLKHGSNDEVLPPYCLSYTYNLANDPKELIFYKGAKHGLDEVAEQVHQVICDWLVKHL